MHDQRNDLLERQFRVLDLVGDRTLMLGSDQLLVPGIALALAFFAGLAQVFSP